MRRVVAARIALCALLMVIVAAAGYFCGSAVDGRRAGGSGSTAPGAAAEDMRRPETDLASEEETDDGDRLGRMILPVTVQRMPRALDLAKTTVRETLPEGIFTEQVCFSDDRDDKPVSYYPYFLELESGMAVSGRTDEDGCTARLYTRKPEEFTVYDGEDAIAKELMLTGELEEE